jgi:hypothetical protein
MRWQRLLSSASAVCVAAVGCDSALSLHAADPGLPQAALVQSAEVRLQKPEVTVKPVVHPSPDPEAETLKSARVVVSVRALVNGFPIFDDEVTDGALTQLLTIRAASDEERKTEVKKIKNGVLDQIIERELLVQEAEHKLRMANKKDVLQKVKEEADEEFQQRVKKLRTNFKSDEEFNNYLKARGTSLDEQKRVAQRTLIAQQYLRSNIMRYVDHRGTFQEVFDYYHSHPEEFQRSDSVQWQDIFIDSAQYPDRDAAYRMAQEVATRARGGDTDDFARLCDRYDNGLAHTKKGAGIGTHRQDISPPEAAAALFEMHDGDIGPIIAVPAGFHVIRLVKRVYPGLAPCDDEVQKAIREKLRNEAFSLESKRFMEEIKKNAHIERIPWP